MNTPLNRDLDRLAQTIAQRGIEYVPYATLRLVAAEARRAGVNPVLADLLVDRSAAPIARSRAFGHLATELAAAYDSAARETAIAA